MNWVILFCLVKKIKSLSGAADDTHKTVIRFQSQYCDTWTVVVRSCSPAKHNFVSQTHTHSHTHMLCVPRESCGTRQEWCLCLRCSRWAPHTWIYETLRCPLELRWGWWGWCDERASLLSIIQGGAGTHCSHVGLTWGQGYIKGIEFERLGIGAEERGRGG